jgi:ComEC/Rec2-related protein
MNSPAQVRRPFVGAVLSAVLGMFITFLVPSSPAGLLSVASGALFLSCMRILRGGGAGILFLSCALLGATAVSIAQIPLPEQNTLPLAEVVSEEQKIAGTVVEDVPLCGRGGSLPVRFQVDAVCLDDVWLRSDALIRIYTSSFPEQPVLGERWVLSGRYRHADKTYSGMRGFFYSKSGHLVGNGDDVFSLKSAGSIIRSKLSEILFSGADSDRDRLMQSLLLGYRGLLPDELETLFSRTGTFHIFAISGLHVGVLAAILVACLKWAGVDKPSWGVILIPLLGVYIISTGMRPSALRAFLMATVYFSAPLFGRRPDAPSSVAFSALILLIANPLQLVSPGFLLSFTVVSGIVMGHSCFASAREGWHYRVSWWSRLSGPHFLAAAQGAITLLVVSSVSAWLFSLPLTARFFNTVSPVALPANLIVIPLTFMVVLTGCMTWVAAPFSESLASLFGYADQLLLDGLLAVLRFSETLPGAYWFVLAPALPIIVLWYVGWAGLFAGPRRIRVLPVGLIILSREQSSANRRHSCAACRKPCNAG